MKMEYLASLLTKKKKLKIGFSIHKKKRKKKKKRGNIQILYSPKQFQYNPKSLIRVANYIKFPWKYFGLVESK